MCLLASYVMYLEKLCPTLIWALSIDCGIYWIYVGEAFVMYNAVLKAGLLELSEGSHTSGTNM